MSKERALVVKEEAIACARTYRTQAYDIVDGNKYGRLARMDNRAYVS